MNGKPSQLCPCLYSPVINMTPSKVLTGSFSRIIITISISKIVVGV